METSSKGSKLRHRFPGKVSKETGHSRQELKLMKELDVEDIG